MRAVLIYIVFTFFFCVFGNAQSFTDIAAAQNVTVIQETPSHFGNGMSFYDFNEDGWDDLTFPTQNDSIAFYKNDNGNFEKIGSMLYAPGEMWQVLWVDYDDNGTLDLCVSYGDLGVRLYSNDGAFNFTDVTAATGISIAPTESYGISFGDSDHDGDLDLYICNYDFNMSSVPNKLYENLGNGTFTEVGVIAGVSNGLQTSFMATWFDYNNDDLIDIHLINDRMQFGDALFENGGGNSFTDVAAGAGVFNDGHNPMSSSVSDFNNDGFQDIFLSDLADGTAVNGVPLDYKLFENQGVGTFNNVAPSLGLDTNILGWGAVWVDYDNDGFEDIYIATSALDTIQANVRSSLLYHNNAGLSFTLMNNIINGNIDNSSYCPVKGDINNDGFYDITVLTHGVPPNILLNDGANTNGHIKITPIGTVSNRMAIGSKVKVYANGISQLQTVFCGSGLCAQNSQHMIFGTGSALIVDSVEIVFPSGIVVKKYNLSVNQNHEIIEQTVAQISFPQGSNVVLCPGDSLLIGNAGFNNYQWSTGSTDSLITVSSSGTYSFTATNNLGDILYQSNSLQLTVETPPIYQVVEVDPLCGAGNLGSISLLFSLPQDSLNTVDWSNGESGFVLDSAASGNYDYTITTVNNCIITGSVSLVETLPFDVQFITTADSRLSDGTVQFFIFGGLAPFTYTLLGNLESELIQNLEAGTYQVEVEDANGCIVTVDFIINDDSPSSLSLEKENLLSFKVFYKNGSLSVCSDAVNEIQTIELRDMTGKRIQMQSEWELLNQDCIQSFVSLTQGIYQVYIKTNNAEISKVIFAH